MSSLHQVLIIGGGIGGLSLAQGLRKAGVPTTVFERDRTPTDRLQGYRIHINPAGSRALHACLPASLFETFVATCGKPGNGFRFLNEKMEVLLSVAMDQPADPVARHHSASRITLRKVLMSGLDGAVQFGKTFTRFEEEPEGKVTAFFEDSASATGDVLVACDGGRSRVREQFLPNAKRVETGVIGIAGKCLLTVENRAKIAPGFLTSAASVMAPGGWGMFFAAQQYRRAEGSNGDIAGDDPALPASALFENTGDYILWAVSARREKFGFQEEPKQLDGIALRSAALDAVRAWHPDFQTLIKSSDPSTVSIQKIGSSIPIPAWETRRVTLLGDAVHSMTPFRGIGANTALRDAALLCEKLQAANRGDMPLLQALHEYESEMIRYGFAAVRSSLKAMERATEESRLKRVITSTVFRALNAFPALKRRAFGALGED
jgi:2-polyprenyl-6-methoxyphenol hydroxylase-like FAD-dependent oxidoreductase